MSSADAPSSNCSTTRSNVTRERPTRIVPLVSRRRPVGSDRSEPSVSMVAVCFISPAKATVRLPRRCCRIAAPAANADGAPRFALQAPAGGCVLLSSRERRSGGRSRLVPSTSVAGVVWLGERFEQRQFGLKLRALPRARRQPHPHHRRARRRHRPQPRPTRPRLAAQLTANLPAHSIQTFEVENVAP